MKKLLVFGVFLLFFGICGEAFAKYEGRMYGMRGLFGGAAGFSTGIDTVLGKVSKKYPVKTYIKPWYRWQEFYATAKANYKIDKLPIFLIGHSLGADYISNIASALEKDGIPVAGAFYYDPTPNVDCVPDNVQAAVGWRRTLPGLGGGSIFLCSRPDTRPDICIRQDDGSMHCIKAKENVETYEKSPPTHNVNTTHTLLDDRPDVHAETLRHVGDILHGKKEEKRR